MRRARYALAAAALTLASGCATPVEGPAALAALENPRSTMTLSMSIEPGTRVSTGEAMTISITPSAPAYVNVFMFNESGRTFQLATDMRAGPQRPLALPPQGADYVLEAMDPPGVDQVLVIASSSALFEPYSPGVPQQVASSQVNVLEDLRGRLAGIPAREWASTGARITVVEAR